MRPPLEHVPWIVRRLTRPWHWRHPRLFVAIELLVAVWGVTAGVLLIAQGCWEGMRCLVLAALVLWFVSLFERAASHRGA